MIDLDPKMFVPLPYDFDKRLLNKVPKPKFFVNNDAFVQQHIDKDKDRKIQKIYKPKSNFFFMQKLIKSMVKAWTKIGRTRIKMGKKIIANKQLIISRRIT